MSNGWRARTPRTPTSAEHPGAAVSWEGEIFEVVAATPLADGHTRYTLSPWDPRHAIRTLEPYDEATEAARAAGRAETVQGERRRWRAIALAPLLGHLPGAVQERMEKEYGAPALLMTYASALPLFVVGVLTLLGVLAGAFGGRLEAAAADAPLFPFLRWIPTPVGLYLLGESAFRLLSAAAASTPCGSLGGILGWELWRQAAGKRAAPQSTARRAPEPPDPSRLHADRYHLLEPLLALLRRDEQESLAARYGFDPLRWGRRTAGWLLAFGLLNVALSLLALAAATAGMGDVLWLLAGSGLAIEQRARRRSLARGEAAGSVLGALVRPHARVILEPGTMARALIFLMLSGCVGGVALGQAPEPAATPPPLWAGKAELSYVATSGNTDTQTLGAGGEVEYRPAPWAVLFRSAFVRSEAEGEENARALTAALRGSRGLSPRLEVFARGDYLQNEFAGIAHRYSAEGGAAYAVSRAHRTS